MKFGFFFGAGAEVSYGMPLGGKFAIDLFRQDNGAEKTKFREMLQGINKTSIYATKWLPDSFYNKNIHAFGKGEFKSLIESSIEYRRSIIIERLNNLEAMVARALKKLSLKPEILSKSFQGLTGKDYGSSLYSQLVKINPTLSGDVKIFASEFYSAVLDIIRTKHDSRKLQKYALSLLQLLIGAYGQELVQKVNQEIFTEAPDDLTMFDDVSGMFRLEFDRIGSSALDLLLKQKSEEKIDENSQPLEIFEGVISEILEDLFIEVLDYQALIDSHWRYLYSPRDNWAKFTKMAIFLNTTRSYMKHIVDSVETEGKTGYYSELEKFSQNDNCICSIGTANYNSLVRDIVGEKVKKEDIFHLNGSLEDFYNPYKNTVIECDNSPPPCDQINVPFMLTQSGIKPLTSISMARRHVNLFDKFKNCDAIIAIGYNFNVDDTHINGIFRQLIEDEGKTLVWVLTKSDKTTTQIKQDLEEKLRLPTTVRSRLSIVTVDRETRLTEDGVFWADAVFDELTQVNKNDNNT